MLCALSFLRCVITLFIVPISVPCSRSCRLLRRDARCRHAAGEAAVGDLWWSFGSVLRCPLPVPDPVDGCEGQGRHTRDGYCLGVCSGSVLFGATHSQMCWEAVTGI